MQYSPYKVKQYNNNDELELCNRNGKQQQQNGKHVTAMDDVVKVK